MGQGKQEEPDAQGLLVYCICEAGKSAALAGLNGVSGRPIFMVESGDLAAAVSSHDSAWGDPGAKVEDALCFANVVEALHREHPVLPLRYGHVLRGTYRVRELLEQRGAEFHAALGKLGSCVEMGLHVLWPTADSVSAGVVPREPTPLSAAGADDHQPGTTYLFGRQARLAETERQTRAAEEVAERWRNAMAGLYVACLAEPRRVSLSTFPGAGATDKPSENPAMLSLTFLVRREDVAVFRGTFRERDRDNSVKLLLSGPWPPFSFAHWAGNWESP